MKWMKWWHAVVLMWLSVAAGTIVREYRHAAPRHAIEAGTVTTTKIGVMRSTKARWP